MSAPVCPRCGTSRWVIPGDEALTLRPSSWMCHRCLARIRAWDRGRLKKAA